MRAVPIRQLPLHCAPPGIHRALLCASRMLPYILTKPLYAYLYWLILLFTYLPKVLGGIVDPFPVWWVYLDPVSQGLTFPLLLCSESSWLQGQLSSEHWSNPNVFYLQPWRHLRRSSQRWCSQGGMMSVQHSAWAGKSIKTALIPGKLGLRVQFKCRNPVGEKKKKPRRRTVKATLPYRWSWGTRRLKVIFENTQKELWVCSKSTAFLASFPTP